MTSSGPVLAEGRGRSEQSNLLLHWPRYGSAISNRYTNDNVRSIWIAVGYETSSSLLCKDVRDYWCCGSENLEQNTRKFFGTNYLLHLLGKTETSMLPTKRNAYIVSFCIITYLPVHTMQTFTTQSTVEADLGFNGKMKRFQSLFLLWTRSFSTRYWTTTIT